MKSPLIFPCKCNAPVHLVCLQTWVDTRPSSNMNLNCEVCQLKYAVEWRKKVIYDSDHACSSRSWRHVLEALKSVMIAVILCWMTFVNLPIAKEKNQDTQDSTAELWMIDGLTVVALLAVGVTIRRSCHRWWESSSSLVLSRTRDKAAYHSSTDSWTAAQEEEGLTVAISGEQEEEPPSDGTARYRLV